MGARRSGNTARHGWTRWADALSRTPKCVFRLLRPTYHLNRLIMQCQQMAVVVPTTIRAFDSCSETHQVPTFAGDVARVEVKEQVLHVSVLATSRPAGSLVAACGRSRRERCPLMRRTRCARVPPSCAGACERHLERSRRQRQQAWRPAARNERCECILQLTDFLKSSFDVRLRAVAGQTRKGEDCGRNETRVDGRPVFEPYVHLE